MSKFDEIYKNIVSENIDDMKEPYKGEMSSQKHKSDTISHPLKDQMIENFLPMIKDSKMEESFYSWIKEAEHQDGEAFWDNFETPTEAVEDFIRSLNFYM
jgi:hypothetical protein